MFLNLHSDEAEAGAEGPGEDAWARLGPCPHMMLAVDARQVHLDIEHEQIARNVLKTGNGRLV